MAKRCLQRTNSARDLRPTKCDQESGFIVGKPKLLPEYNLYKVPDTKSNFQTKFEAFKSKVYVDQDDATLQTFFYDPKTYDLKDLKELKSNGKTEDKKYDYLQNLSEARKRTYLDFKYIPEQAGTQGTEKQFILNKAKLKEIKEKITALKDKDNSQITKAIINSMLGIVLPPPPPPASTAQAKKTQLDDKEKEKEKLKFALNILNYENEVLRGNINTRLNQKEYKISTTAKKTEQNFEGYIDNEDNVYADKGFLVLPKKLIDALKKFKNDLITEPITNILPLPVGQEKKSQAKTQDEEPLKSKLETYLNALNAGSHKRELLKTFDQKN
jgi:hypothetical protein